MDRKAFSIPVPSSHSWEEVFNQSHHITHQAFITAQSVLKTGGALNLKHPNAKGIKTKSQKAPVLVHWIRHRKFGDYLIDAGMDRSYQNNPYGLFKGLLVRVFMAKCFQKPGQDTFSLIQQHQIKLNGIFFTHLHFDHISGAIDFPDDKAVPYVAGKGEIYFSVQKGFLFRSPDYFKGKDVLYELNFSDSHVVDMPILGKSADIFGDGSLWAISTPGHTKGHISFLVNCEKEPVLITGDACLLKANLDMGIGPGTYSSDLEAAQESMDKIIRFTQKYPRIKIVYGHQLS